MQKRIVKWIKSVVKESKAKGVVLGISGGVDSAVVAALCCKALGKDRVMGLIMPCHSHKDDTIYANLLISRLDIPHKYISLDKTYDVFLKTLPKASKMAVANIKPRLRMATLYYFANFLNYLVVGTGNRSELTVGYFTKYGDGGVDILPIGGLLKSQVYVLAEELGAPRGIVERAPTAGLWPGQTDEKEMGVTYRKLDETLRKCKNIKSLRDKRIRRMVQNAQHKLSLPLIPDGAN